MQKFEKNKSNYKLKDKDYIGDNHLAQLFIEANNQTLIDQPKEIINIFKEKKEIFVHSVYSPDQKQKKEILLSIEKKEIMHKKMLHKKKKTWFKNFLNFFKKNIFYKYFTKKNIIPYCTSVNWNYYLLYNNIWKKKINLYLNDFSTYVEIAFKNKQKFKEILKIEFLFFFSGIIISLFITTSLFEFAKINTISSGFKGLFEYWKILLFFFNVFALCFLLFPYMVLLSMWFVNINNLIFSKKFHYFLISLFSISYVIFFISLINLILLCFIN